MDGAVVQWCCVIVYFMIYVEYFVLKKSLSKTQSENRRTGVIALMKMTKGKACTFYGGVTKGKKTKLNLIFTHHRSALTCADIM